MSFYRNLIIYFPPKKFKNQYKKITSYLASINYFTYILLELKV